MDKIGSFADVVAWSLPNTDLIVVMGMIMFLKIGFLSIQRCLYSYWGVLDNWEHTREHNCTINIVQQCFLLTAAALVLAMMAWIPQNPTHRPSPGKMSRSSGIPKSLI